MNSPMAGWYFAYGSNLWTRQMIQRVGSIGDPEQPPRIARLANHRLVFQHLEDAGPAFANIVCPGPGVIGVVYYCNPLELEKLDRYESGYQRLPLEVTDETGEVLAAEGYIIKPATGVGYGNPSPEYLKRIIDGAAGHGLPASYIKSIVAAAKLIAR